jgi:hypothetical protein
VDGEGCEGGGYATGCCVGLSYNSDGSDVSTSAGVAGERSVQDKGQVPKEHLAH